MTSDNFDVKILAEKLSKLNNSQQSIESLSRWCVSHRKKARQIVETWDKAFNSSEKDQRVSSLFLANDILQNSRRKGSEFVNEFWKVLPAALKRVYKNGDEHGKKTVSRLVDIWEERKVFGSRAQNLKEELFGKEALVSTEALSAKEALVSKEVPSQLVTNGKSSNPVKIVKKDAQAIRIKLAVGDVIEKIVMAFHDLHDQCSNEESTLAKCHVAVLSLETLEKDVEAASAQGLQPGTAMVNQLQDHETMLLQCIEQLEGAESTRVALVSQLKEALQNQGKMLETVQSQLQLARSRICASGNLRQKLFSGTMELGGELEKQKAVDSSKPTNSLQLQKPTTCFAPLGASSEDNKKATAAAVAAKLAASTSSSQMFASVLSSLVAEEAAKAEKRQKLDTDSSSGAAPPFYSNLPFTQNNQIQSSLPPPPPPPPLPSSAANNNQFMQSLSGGMMMLPSMPFGYVGNTIPLPPTIPSSVSMGGLGGRPPIQQSQPPISQQQMPPVSSGSGYYMPQNMGISIYGQNQQATTPSPVHRH